MSCTFSIQLPIPIQMLNKSLTIIILHKWNKCHPTAKLLIRLVDLIKIHNTADYYTIRNVKIIYYCYLFLSISASVLLLPIPTRYAVNHYYRFFFLLSRMQLYGLRIKWTEYFNCMKLVARSITYHMFIINKLQIGIGKNVIAK